MKKTLQACALTAVLCAGLCLAGCASAADDEGEGQQSASEQVSAEQLEEMFLNSTDAFAVDFATGSLASAQENTCVSPLSLYYALAMVASGVQGDAQAQLLQALGVDDAAQLESICKYGLSELDTENDQYKLALADSIWVSEDYKVTDRFKKIAADDYSADAFSVEFGTQKADTDMSDWVSDKTAGLLTPKFTTTSDQIASLINTVYFKDAWVKQFSPDDTVSNVFHLVTGEGVQVPFMNVSIDGCGYADMDTYTMSEMYFTSGSTMTFYLPKGAVSPQDLIATPEAMDALLSAEPVDFPNIDYSVPRFSFATSMQNLIPQLQALGITDIFTNPSGDAFETMLEYAGKGTEAAPYVSEVIQETNIDVAEEGVEAAAYTEVGIEKMSLGSPDEPIGIVLNRPFLFKITAPNSAVLFVGIVMDPLA